MSERGPADGYRTKTLVVAWDFLEEAAQHELIRDPFEPTGLSVDAKIETVRRHGCCVVHHVAQLQSRNMPAAGNRRPAIRLNNSSANSARDRPGTSVMAIQCRMAISRFRAMTLGHG
jgi:hypothetical protein